MSWHDLEDGFEYQFEDVIPLLEKRVVAGEVEDVEGKKKFIGLMKSKRSESAFFQPDSNGWGRSPFNPNVWKTIEGEVFF
jgi:hypothetical protein